MTERTTVHEGMVAQLPPAVQERCRSLLAFIQGWGRSLDAVHSNSGSLEMMQGGDDNVYIVYVAAVGTRPFSKDELGGLLKRSVEKLTESGRFE